jgi:hypothetical protein
MPSPFIGRGGGGSGGTNESSSGGSSDFFSPVSINFFRRAVHGAGEPTTSTMTTQQQQRTLNTSWIGARLSPIQSFDNDCCEPNHPTAADRGGDNDIERPARRHASTLDDAPFVTERTNLLFGQRFGNNQRRNATTPYRLHPLWKHHDGRNHNNNKNASSPHNSSASTASPEHDHTTVYRRSPFPIFLCWVSGLHLLAMGVYDLSHILGLVSTTTTSAERHLWSLPALTPPEETLLAFGCYDRSAYSQTSLGRWLLQMLTCTVICTSVVDWLLLCVSWNMIAMALRHSSGESSSTKTLPGTTTNPQSLSAFLVSSNGTFGIFIASVLIGLVWANTYDATRDPTPLGLATVGTAGVLGNIGSRDISQRYPLYCVNAIWLTLALVVPDHSVFAMAGSIALGSALGFTSLTTRTFPVETPGNLPAQAQSQRNCSMVITLMATACAVGIVAVPILTLAFPSTFGMIVE